MKKNSSTKDLVLCAFFIALGIVLPFLTAQLQAVGQMLLPMHLPVFLCGLICGWQYGLICGIVTPILRSALFSMPPMVPTAVAMSCELAVYGGLSGYLFGRLRSSSILSVYEAMIPAMILGRIVSGLVNLAILTSSGGSYSWPVFLSANFTSGIPGIILQLVLIPMIVGALCQMGVMRWPAARKQAS